MPDDIFSQLDIAPTSVPSLPAKARTALIAHLLRWNHHNAARHCLQELVASHGRLVSIHDYLARTHMALGDPKRALEVIQRRQAIRISNTSRALEARVRLAAGDQPGAEAIVQQLAAEHPSMLLTWSLQADVRLAAGDLDGAEAAWRKRETLKPGAAENSLGLARVWQARGDNDKALLWARTALSRTRRDGRQPSVALLRLLEALYRATGQTAQAKATAATLRERQKQEVADLRQALDRQPQRAQAPPAAIAPMETPTLVADVTYNFAPQVLSAALEPSPQERQRLNTALHRYFAHDSLRPGQAETITAILRGESVLAVMPTGAGKSLCYQLAALLLPGTTLVISPLIALMKDQLDGLPPTVTSQATTLNSSLEGHELDARLARTSKGGYKLVYAAPERLRQRPFLHALKRAGVSLLVVDEAHCISLWGHDFRPDYHFITHAWRELGQPAILALTATATPRVRDDIQSALGQVRLVLTDLHRPNLYLEARRFRAEAQKRQALVTLCRQIEGSGIVYATTRKKCEDLADMLRSKGISAIHYHAGIQDRAHTQERFMRGEARIVVATIAFGMGIDKADVRFVIHYNPPKTLENYYQEAGRAGRDGSPAHCILLHAPSDTANLNRWTRQETLDAAFLRRVYHAIQRRVGDRGVGLVAVGDLERDLGADETPLRVAIHFLERAGLLQRGFDLPRTASLTLLRPIPGQEAPPPDGDITEFARFVEAARLRPGQIVNRNLIAISREAGLAAESIEAKLLSWADAGWLRYRGVGRDMLLTLPEPPSDSRQRVNAMLADLEAGKQGRVGELMAYAATGNCRHAYISTYFGGRPIKHCRSCDNCLGTAVNALPSKPMPAPGRKRADEHQRPPSQGGVGSEAAAQIVLRGVAQLPYPLGRRGLARALQGAATSPVQADRFPPFGALADMTQKWIRMIATSLVTEGYLEQYRKAGYLPLRLTRRGQDWLEAANRGEKLPALDLPLPSDPQPPVEYDETLFERLRAWRRRTAQEMALPAFVVFHDATLKRIAASRPTTLDELLSIRGIGPRKLERYGQSVLEIVARRDDNQTQMLSGRRPQA